MKRFLVALALIFTATTFARQIQFYDPEVGYGIALSTIFLDNGTQILMQLSAPTSHGWAAFGSGDMMAGSTMFVIYPSSNNSEVTLSVRTTKNHDPPKEIEPNKIHARVRSSTIKDGRMTANIVWQEQGKILSGVVNPAQHAQAFIWALGPGIAIRSDETDVPLTKHQDDRGIIFGNMPNSQTPQEEVKPPEIQGTNSDGFESQPEYYHTLVYLHAGLMVASFILILPFGVILLRLNPKNFGFKLHIALQCFAFFAIVAGLGVAVTMSILGKRYKHFTEPHQLVGIGVSVLAAFQVYLGRAHHIRFKIHKKRNPFSYLHMVIGRFVIYGGMVNAVLGLILCRRQIPVYIAGGVAAILALAQEFFSVRFHLKQRHDDLRSDRIRGYNSRYQKLKDITVTEQEVGVTHDIPMQRYSGYGYAQKLYQ